MANIAKILPFTLKWEGTAYTDHPEDDGGATKYGVTQAALSKYLGRQASKTEVRNMTLGTAQEVYYKDYWGPMHCEDMSDGVALMVFDGSVNHGIKRMTEFVQEVVGTKVDGDFGPKTEKAVLEYEDRYMLVVQLANKRRERYVNHPDFPTFGTGWMNRLNDIQNNALAFENKFIIKKPEAEVIEDKVEEKPEEVIVPDGSNDIKLDDVDDTLSNETLQKLLASVNLYTGKIDGLIGPKTKAAMKTLVLSEVSSSANWSYDRMKIAVGQIFATKWDIETGIIDGFLGPQTKQAFKELNYKVLTGEELPKWRDEVDAQPPAPGIIFPKSDWPYQRDVPKFYGEVGKNQVLIQTPYTMRLAWDLNTKINRFSCHEKVHDSLQRIFNKTLSAYGERKINDLGLDLFAGCLNVRKKRGGSSYSMHSWGIAVDLDSEHNQLSWGRDRARFAGVEYEEFWRIVESEGWLSLGRANNFDWMHFEATKG